MPVYETSIELPIIVKYDITQDKNQLECIKIRSIDHDCVGETINVGKLEREIRRWLDGYR